MSILISCNAVGMNDYFVTCLSNEYLSGYLDWRKCAKSDL
jgi:hypothetical protein